MDLNLNAKKNETIRQHTDELKERSNLLYVLGYITDNNLYNDLLTACEYHDYGKANSEFQKRVKSNNKFNPATEIPHNVLSMFYVDKDKCTDYISVCFAVMYHHYHFESPITIFRQESDLINKFLSEMGGKYIPYEKIKMTAVKIGRLFNKTFDDKQKQYAVLLKGFLHKCDYSASAGIPCEIKNDFLALTMQNWLRTKDEIRPVQKFCLENTDSNLIITAPTGMGKTEAGLLWCGNHKCFFVLPLKTAINAMFDRLIEPYGDEYKNKVALIHSDMKAKYLEKNKTDDFDLDYYMVSKQMSLPITVCTPDQIFDFVMKYPGYEYKLATGSYSRFIIDEIQMYSADLLAAIIYAIEMLHKSGAKFAILTATLPPFVKMELMRIFGEDVNTADFSRFGKPRHNVKVQEKEMKSEDIIDSIDNSISNKVKKFLVVCNTIDTANIIYTKLKDHYDGKITVNLFHSQFIRQDRKIKESKILKAKDREEPEIWVSTSVVEASLDIDFDILFTELSDLFSLFQRFGRVNRKGEKDFDKYNAYVFTELQGNARKGFIDKTIHQLSKEAIMTVNGVITEEDKNSLIKEYLSVERIENSDYYEKYKKSYNYYSEKIEYVDRDTSIRDIDTISVIPKQVYYDNIEEIEKAQDTIKSSDSSYPKKLEANEEIMDLTVSVSSYRLRSCGTVGYVKNRYNQIPILDNCEYNDKDGLEITGKAELDKIGGFVDY